MDLRWLDDVLVLLEEGNLTRAAERRNITQPAFSRRIRAFEDWLGAPIIERQTNRIQASPALTSNEAEIRALASRLKDLRTKVASYEPARSVVTIAAQHAPAQSVFPDLARRATNAGRGLNFRLRAGNLNDCVAMFVRGDANMLLCYEAEANGPLAFGAKVERAHWGTDVLVPIVGGALRGAVRDDGTPPPETPAITYPASSYFGQVLLASKCAFGTAEFSANPICMTAFSSGILELVGHGLGVGWVPFSMAHEDIESGRLVSLAQSLGKVPLDVAVYADGKSETATRLLQLWSS